MEVALLELGVTVGIEATKSYLNHRQQLIDEHREDELISSRVNKYLREQYINMSTSRDNTPVNSSPLIAPSPTTTETTTSKIRDFLRSITPVRRSAPALADSVQPEFQEFVRKLLVFIRNESICQIQTVIC